MTARSNDDDIMSLSSGAPINPELQLSVNDLVHPTETAETLLETLSNEQLNIIEEALNKIKEKKLGKSNQTKDNKPCSTPNDHISNQSTHLNSATAESKPTTIKDTLSTVTQKQPKTQPKPPSSTSPFLSSHEPTTEIREGVEWVSFVYSHHRTLRRYCIRTDLDEVDTSILDDKFKKENCVYPRANLPRETYRGNRWAYETECNVLGWKLAYLNMEEIAGKRGLIQRAVDSYRNRYPSMRSRRVARQEKLLKGTLRKRKQRDSAEDEDMSNKMIKSSYESDKTPKTLLIEDLTNHTKCRIRINIESVILDAVDMNFRKNNCVFPRAMNITPDTPSVSQRRLEEARCNEIGWKLAWLNPRQLANKKNILQRALDTYRQQFTPDLKPRKYASYPPPLPYTPPAASVETPPVETPCADIPIKTESEHVPLTEEVLAEQQKALLSTEDMSMMNTQRRDSSGGQSCYSGSTVTLDFHDYCFSPPAEDGDDELGSCEDTMNDLSTVNSPVLYPASMFDDLILSLPTIADIAVNTTPNDAYVKENDDCHLSESSTSQNYSYQNTPSPSDPVDTLLTLSEIYQQAFLLNSEGLFNNHLVKEEASTLFSLSDTVNTDILTKFDNNNLADEYTVDPLLNQLF